MGSGRGRGSWGFLKLSKVLLVIFLLAATSEFSGLFQGFSMHPPEILEEFSRILFGISKDSRWVL